MPSKIISELRTPCRADQDVFAAAHMLLLDVVKDNLERQNRFLNKVVVFGATSKTFDQTFWRLH